MSKVMNKLAIGLVALSLMVAAVGLPLNAAFARQDEATVKFQKLTPADGAVDVNAQNVFLSWTEYTGADRYKFCIYKDGATKPNDCSVGDPHWTGSFSKHYTVTNLAPNTLYHWKLLASTCWNKGCNEWKEADHGVDFSFTTKNNPNQFVVISGSTPFSGLIVNYHDSLGDDYYGKTNSVGKFSFPIPFESSGDLTVYHPSIRFYTFEPMVRSYLATDTDSNLVNQNFKGYAPITIVVQVGIAGADVTFHGWGAYENFNIEKDPTGELVKVTDANGKVQLNLPWGWMGSITPSIAGHSFTPSSQGLPPVKSSDKTITFTVHTP